MPATTSPKGSEPGETGISVFWRETRRYCSFAGSISLFDRPNNKNLPRIGKSFRRYDHPSLLRGDVGSLSGQDESIISYGKYIFGRGAEKQRVNCLLECQLLEAFPVLHDISTAGWKLSDLVSASALRASVLVFALVPRSASTLIPQVAESTLGRAINRAPLGTPYSRRFTSSLSFGEGNRNGGKY